MGLILLATFIAVICLFLVYVFYRNEQKVIGLEQELNIAQSTLSELQAIEVKLKDELANSQQKAQQTLEDPVTHLLGWQLFEDRLSQNIKESLRYQLTMGVLFVDIDDFKVINDALSYEVGDLVLQEVSTRLQTCIRQVDSISRFTKDTFVILLAQLAKPETAAVVAQRILQTLAQPLIIEDRELFLTASVGIAIYPSDGGDVASLLRSADHALHLAKERGKNCYQFYQEKMYEKSQRELTLYNSLSKEAISSEFVIFYQPIFDTRTNKVICMDAWLHWQNPELGLIKPPELFNYAEKQRKLNNITEWLLKSACKQFLEWKAAGFAPPFLGIPICLKQLENTHFIYRLSQVLQELKLSPECIVLEIKEGTSQLPFDVLEKAFNMLNYLNVKVAMDNFGLGSFPLSYLKNLKISYLKLDSSITEDVLHNPRTAALLESMTQLANGLSMQLIVQEVSSAEQVALLKKLDCYLMQGRYFGEPIEQGNVVNKLSALIH